MNLEYSGYNIVSDGTYGNLVIKAIGKGALPVALKGSFTKSKFAQIAIDSYVEVKKNGKAKLTS